MAKQVASKNCIILLGLIAYKYGEISEGKCVEVTGWSRDKIRDEMLKRVGKARPYDEAVAEAEYWKREYESLVAIVGAASMTANSPTFSEQ